MSTTIIFHKTYKLYVSFQKHVIRFPKYYRHTLGEHIDEHILRLLELLLQAEKKSPKSKLLMLKKADIVLQITKLLVRTAYDLSALKQSGYIALQEQIVEIGKMLGGWIKHTKNTG